MNILRKIALFYFGSTLLILLSVNTFVWTTRQTVLDRQVVFSWMREGKVYDNIADAAAKLAEKSLKEKTENQNTGNAESADGPDATTLLKAAKVAFPPSVLQEDVEIFLNSMYDWLEGKTSTVIMNLDITSEKAAFINALGDEAISRAAALPTCNAPLSSDFDPLKSECIPKGVNIAAQAEKIKAELSTSTDFIPKTVFTGADITVGSGPEKKSIYEAENIKNLPKVFEYVRDLAFVTLALIVIFGVAVYLLGKNRRSGLKINAWLFGLGGAWALILGLLFNASKTITADKAFSNPDTTIARSVVEPLINQITTTLAKWHLILGGAYILVSVVCIIMIKSKSNSDKISQKIESSQKPNDKQAKTSSQAASPSPVSKTQPTKPAKKTTLVQ